MRHLGIKLWITTTKMSSAENFSPKTVLRLRHNITGNRSSFCPHKKVAGKGESWLVPRPVFLRKQMGQSAMPVFQPEPEYREPPTENAHQKLPLIQQQDTCIYARNCPNVYHFEQMKVLVKTAESISTQRTWYWQLDCDHCHFVISNEGKPSTRGSNLQLLLPSCTVVDLHNLGWMWPIVHWFWVVLQFENREGGSCTSPLPGCRAGPLFITRFIDLSKILFWWILA